MRLREEKTDLQVERMWRGMGGEKKTDVKEDGGWRTKRREGWRRGGHGGEEDGEMEDKEGRTVGKKRMTTTLAHRLRTHGKRTNQ